MNHQHRLYIGNQTAFSAGSLLEPFEFALDNGFGAFEWFPDKKPWGGGWDSAEMDSSVRSYIRDAARATGLRQSVHAHWTANPLRAEALPVLLRDLDLARELGAVLLNVHLYPEDGIRAYAKSILPWLENAAEQGLQISIENTPETTPQHFNELFNELRRMNTPASSAAGMCYDLGHANLCPATRNDYLGYLDQLEAHVPIIHLHVHENRGDADSHLPLFTGPAAENPCGIDGFLRRLEKREYSGSLILEQWPNPPSLLTTARNRLMEMSGTMWAHHGICRAAAHPVAEAPASGGTIELTEQRAGATTAEV